MEEWIGIIFFILMGVFVLVLIVGAGVAYLRAKKQDEMWEKADELDDDTLEQMAEKAEGKKKKKAQEKEPA